MYLVHAYTVIVEESLNPIKSLESITTMKINDDRYEVECFDWSHSCLANDFKSKHE